MRLRDCPVPDDFLVCSRLGKVRRCIASVDGGGLSYHISDYTCAYAIRIYRWFERTSTVQAAIERKAKSDRPVVEIGSIQHEIPRARKEILADGNGFTDGNWRLSGYCCRKLHIVDGGILSKDISRQSHGSPLHGKSVFWCSPYPCECSRGDD